MTVEVTSFLEVKVVYVHGFRGSVRTFANFPERLGQAISLLNDNRLRNVRVDTQIYPYETRGRYTVASERLDAELRRLILESWRDCKALAIILVGHSMGGLVAADTIRYIYNKGHPLPNNADVIGLLAYDTPYYSLDPGFVRSAFRDLTHRPWTWGLQMVINGTTHERGSWWEEAAVNVQGSIKNSLFPEAIRHSKPIRTLATTSSLLGLLGYYTYRELTYAPIDNDDNGSYLNKLYEYFIFAKETFGSSELQEQRVLDLVRNERILFRCIYNRFPAVEGFENDGDRKFIHVPANIEQVQNPVNMEQVQNPVNMEQVQNPVNIEQVQDPVNMEQVQPPSDMDQIQPAFIALDWSSDPWQGSRYHRDTEGTETILLAHTTMFGSANAVTENQLRDRSTAIMKDMILQHLRIAPQT